MKKTSFVIVFCSFSDGHHIFGRLKVQILMLCFSRLPRIHVFIFFQARPLVANIRGGEPSALYETLTAKQCFLENWQRI
jgi:hypothetical protein